MAEAQRSVQSTLLWHLRVLAGWEPPTHVERIRALAGGFEIANVVSRLASLGGHPEPEPFQLGSLATVWQPVSRLDTAEAIREALARSDWRDPESVLVGPVLLSMRLAWCRKVYEDVPVAAPWAKQAARLIQLNLSLREAATSLSTAARRDLRRVLGGDLEPGVGVQPSDLWSAECRWWSQVESQSEALAAHGDTGEGGVVAVVGLLAADAWRTCAALALAGRDSDDGDLRTVLGVVA